MRPGQVKVDKLDIASGRIGISVVGWMFMGLCLSWAMTYKNGSRLNLKNLTKNINQLMILTNKDSMSVPMIHTDSSTLTH